MEQPVRYCTVQYSMAFWSQVLPMVRFPIPYIVPTITASRHDSIR